MAYLPWSHETWRGACADESARQRQDLSLRSAPPGSRVVAFRKENAATQGLQLGLKFRESFGKAVYIDAILPGSQAARLEKQGKLRKGDEVVMVSATFGDEMWSSRGIGKQRLEKSIAVRQGQTIKFVLEASDDNSKAKKKALAEKLKKEQAMTSRLQAELAKEVDAAKSKPKGNGKGKGQYDSSRPNAIPPPSVPRAPRERRKASQEHFGAFLVQTI